MLRSLRKLSGCRLRAADGDLGKPRTWLLDDSYWAGRYLVVDQVLWLRHRKVLVPPSAFGEIDESACAFFLEGTRTSLAAHSPKETDVNESWPLDRDHSHSIGRVWHEGIGHKNRAVVETRMQDPEATAGEHGNPHVCTWQEVFGCRIHAGDAELGRISDLIAEDRTWTILYLVMDAGHWWAEKKLVVLPDWIDCVDWQKALVRVKVARQLICDAPQFVPSLLFKREYEQELLNMYYGQPA